MYPKFFVRLFWDDRKIVIIFIVPFLVKIAVIWSHGSMLSTRSNWDDTVCARGSVNVARRDIDKVQQYTVVNMRTIQQTEDFKWWFRNSSTYRYLQPCSKRMSRMQNHAIVNRWYKVSHTQHNLLYTMDRISMCTAVDAKIDFPYATIR